MRSPEWAAIKPMMPNKPRGVPRVNDRRVLNGIFWVLRSGAPWRDLPDADFRLEVRAGVARSALSTSFANRNGGGRSTSSAIEGRVQVVFPLRPEWRVRATLAQERRGYFSRVGPAALCRCPSADARQVMFPGKGARRGCSDLQHPAGRAGYGERTQQPAALNRARAASEIGSDEPEPNSG